MSITVSHDPAAQVGRDDLKLYRRLMVLAVVLFFFTAVIRRLLHLGARPMVAATGKPESLLHEARRMAGTVLPFAFMN
jgi:hypothetical protein